MAAKPNMAPMKLLIATAALSLATSTMAQTQTPTRTEPEPDHSYLNPALEIVGFDFLLNRFNRKFSGVSDYDVSVGTIRRNLRGPWVTDNDPFKINQFAHPYQGSIYHTAARSSGLGYWTSTAYTFAGSAWWEITGEQTPPSKNDQVASGIAGSFLGEPLYRMARLMSGRSSGVPQVWRDWAAAAISPAYGFNHLVYGSRFDAAFDDHDPVYYSRLRLGANRNLGPQSRGADVRRQDAEVDFAIDYGLPGQRGYTYNRPFDYFALRAMATTANGVEMLSTRGLLWGGSYGEGDEFRGIMGIYANYDYLAPQIFHVSTTALSIGSTGQWSPSPSLTMQGTLLAGVGYSAASIRRPTPDDKNYHYGMAPRFGGSLRVIAGSRVSWDLDAEEYLLGRIANRNAGRDNIARVDTALTLRLAGRHAVGVKYSWSHRNPNVPGSGERPQTLATVGLYYTLLGLDDFGTVTWKKDHE